MVHVEAIRISLLWIRAYVNRLVGGGELARTVDANTCVAQRAHDQGHVRRVWGIGATLGVEGEIVAWLSDMFS